MVILVVMVVVTVLVVVAVVSDMVVSMVVVVVMTGVTVVVLVTKLVLVNLVVVTVMVVMVIVVMLVVVVTRVTVGDGDACDPALIQVSNKIPTLSGTEKPSQNVREEYETKIFIAPKLFKLERFGFHQCAEETIFYLEGYV